MCVITGGSIIRFNSKDLTEVCIQGRCLFVGAVAAYLKSYAITIVKQCKPRTCEKDIGIGAAFCFLNFILTSVGVNSFFFFVVAVLVVVVVVVVCVCVCVYVCVCVCVCMCVIL